MNAILLTFAISERHKVVYMHKLFSLFWPLWRQQELCGETNAVGVAKHCVGPSTKYGHTFLVDYSVNVVCLAVYVLTVAEMIKRWHHGL